MYVGLRVRVYGLRVSGFGVQGFRGSREEFLCETCGY